MDLKRWPILAQVLLGLGCIGSLRNIAAGWVGHDYFNILIGLGGFFIFWSVYKFKSWAPLGLTIFLSLNILVLILGILGGFPIVVAFISIAINGFTIYYFNSAKIKTLFQ